MRIGSDALKVLFRIYVEEHAGIVAFDEAQGIAMAIDHGTRARITRKRQELQVQAMREPNGMAALAAIRRGGDLRPRLQRFDDSARRRVRVEDYN